MLGYTAVAHPNNSVALIFLPNFWFPISNAVACVMVFDVIGLFFKAYGHAHCC
jgi:hypothetical protein